MKKILILIVLILVFIASPNTVNAQFKNDEVQNNTLMDIQEFKILTENDLNQEVVFEDKNLQRQIIEKLGIDEIVKVKDMLKIEEITLNDVSSLVGLEYASNLRDLEIINSETSLDVIIRLSNLEILKLSNCKTNFSDISQAINLKELAIENSSLLDISFASGLYNLKVLFLKNNFISDTMPLLSLTNLDTLNLENNYLISILDILTLSDMGAFTSTGSAINLDNNYLDTSPNSFNCFYFDMLNQKGIEVNYNNQNTVEEISEVVIEKEKELYNINLKEYIHAKAYEDFVYDNDNNQLFDIKYIKGENSYYRYEDYIDARDILGNHIYKALGYLNNKNQSVSIDFKPFDFE